MTRLTPKQFRELMNAGHCSLSGEQALSAGKGRVQSAKVEVDGHTFDSQLEANIYWEFKVDPNMEILEFQPSFCLQSEFVRDSKTYKAINYTADFKIKDGGQEWIVEVKSVGTIKANSKSYPMRRKMFLKKFPKYAFREIIFDKGQKIVKEY